MTWRALVPIKSAGDRKTRLAPHLSADERVWLSDAMLWHVLTVLQRVGDIADIAILAERPLAGWHGGWVADRGRGLNMELAEAASSVGAPLLVIHADLPALTCKDVAALLDATHAGSAIAPDRHQRGTNAIALRHAVRFKFSFGDDSLRRHQAGLGGQPAVVRRPGLATDVDLPEDLEVALSLLEHDISGFAMACVLRAVRQTA